MSAGGFDVIIGNPPYVEYNKIKKEYTVRNYNTENCSNLYAYVVERCLNILCENGRTGMIVQLPIVCTDRMQPLQKELLEKSSSIWFSNFDDRPARLFDGLEHIRATIFLTQKEICNTNMRYSTTYNRWYSEFRPKLFEMLSFTESSDFFMAGTIPKIGQKTAKMVREIIAPFAPLRNNFTSAYKSVSVYFHNAPQYWIRAMNFAPYFWNERNGEHISTQVKILSLPSKNDAAIIVAALNSSVFYWWFLILSDCRHLNMREIENFPLGLERFSEAAKMQLIVLTNDLMRDMKQHKQRKHCQYKTTGKVVYDEFYPKNSKSIIDKIDTVLAQHYGFTDEELDYIINYDIKYRMGNNDDENGDDE
jgi:hypothetical protein